MKVIIFNLRNLIQKSEQKTPYGLFSVRESSLARIHVQKQTIFTEEFQGYLVRPNKSAYNNQAQENKNIFFIVKVNYMRLGVKISRGFCQTRPVQYFHPTSMSSNYLYVTNPKFISVLFGQQCAAITLAFKRQIRVYTHLYLHSRIRFYGMNVR